MKNQYKEWLRNVALSLCLFILFNYFIWKAYTEKLLVDGPLNGDYTRVGYIHGSSYETKPGYGLPKKHLENFEYNGQNIDILTIGDSFSNSGGKADQFYQDWISTLQNKTVLNVQKLPGKHFFETLTILANSGYLDRIKPNAVILQIVQRHAIDFLSTPKDLSLSMPLAQVEEIYKKSKYKLEPPDINFINLGNLKFCLYYFLYKVRPNAFFSKVYVMPLNQPLFSVKNAKRLIFSYEDIEHLSRENEDSVSKLNDNLNRLAELLQSKGIKLYFMPVVDKYNLYEEFIKENPFPKSRFFEILRKMKKTYEMIDTKDILLPEIRRGEEDVYYADDSHWTEKAPRKIFEKTQF